MTDPTLTPAKIADLKQLLPVLDTITLVDLEGGLDVNQVEPARRILTLTRALLAAAERCSQAEVELTEARYLIDAQRATIYLAKRHKEIERARAEQAEAARDALRDRFAAAEREVAKLRHVERAARGVVRQFDDAGEACDGELIDALAALDVARDGSKA